MFKKLFLPLSILFIAFVLTACASTNNAQQHYLLGQQYYHAQNFNDAFKEINQAAQAGNIDAQYALGYLYFNGVGTAADNTAGLFWIKQAATNGQPQAKKALKLLNAKSPLPLAGKG